MKTLTVQELQENFEYYLDRVKVGESFLIKSKYGEVMLVPYNNGEQEVDDLIRIHTDHEEGC